ncbi:MAG: hypothetical protein JNL02_13625 [Saprospiraceae bacterium]|nr:hypothetical protein [Saprospiraceae bacterium]
MTALKTAFSCLFLLWTLSAEAQSIDERLRELYDRDAYEEILQLAPTAGKLSDTSLFIVGRAYYNQDDEVNAQIYFKQATDRNPKYATAWFYRSQAGYFLKDSAEAFSSIHRAIAIDANRPFFWSWKGDLYYIWNKLDSALIFYQHALTLPDCPGRPYVQIGNLLSDMDRNAEAIEAFKVAKTKVESDSDEYLECLYNIGFLGYHEGQLPLAEKSLKEFLLLAPTEYRAVSLLIQVYYAQKQYANGDALKPILYSAWRAKKLPKNMSEDFCIDQFKWNGQRVMVYERYVSSGLLYYKHVFYLFNKEGKTELTLQTESSAAVRSGESHYVLGMDKGKKHYTYIQFRFPEEPDYDELKQAVIDVLDGKEKASSSSARN